MFLRQYLLNLADKAKKDNEKNILSLLETDSRARLLDLGCDDGQWTFELGKKIGTQNIFGIEVVDKQVRKAKEAGIDCRKADLNKSIPFSDDFFDIIHANQVIEHIHNLDNFIQEIYRILKPGGYVVVSTENLASWHNIFSLFFGWQPFSATNYILKTIGNPLALWKGYIPTVDKSWCHDKLWAYRGLIDFFEVYRFKVDKIQGAGYYPFFSFLGNIDKRHCHFITIKAIKEQPDFVLEK